MSVVIAYLVAAAVAAGSGGAATTDAPFTGDLGYRDGGPAVAELNEALADAGFSPDEGDHFGKKTRHAVYAFQKHHQLGVTGVFKPFMWDLLGEPIELPRRQEQDRVEVDLGRQVLYLVEDHRVVLVLPISSGNGASYIGSNGRRQIASTPEGRFRFQRRIIGIRRAPLGTLWNPHYFRGGIAVHGSPSVPNRPASHGCIRVTLWDMELLMEHLEIGQRIYVYGGRTEPPPPLETADPPYVEPSRFRPTTWIR